jgi:hypothetical protein
MAYFNHTYKKSFLATGNTQSNMTITDPTGISLVTLANTSNGYLITAGLPTYSLNQLSLQSNNTVTTSGYIGWFNSKTQLSLNIDYPNVNCCPIFLAGSTLYSCDKISNLSGGYQETNKSKEINPKYVTSFRSVAPCSSQNNVIHIGSTYWTAGGGVLTGTISTPGIGYTPPNLILPIGVSTSTLTGTGTGLELSITIFGGVPTVIEIVNPGKGYSIGDTVSIASPTGTPSGFAIYTVNSVTSSHSQEGCDNINECCKEFLCNETYSLRLDIKGSPALRFLNHNAYNTVDFYTGCCPDNTIVPNPVDSTLVMIGWANLLITNPIVGPFIQIVIQTELGDLLYAPKTDIDFLTANSAITWNNYISSGHTFNKCAGLIINGAYVDTKFGNCSFQVTDFYEKEPVKLYASEIDLNGDPCTFQTLCIVTECEGLQAQGLGETILRDLVLSEAYRQSFLATDIRIREITKGNEILNSIDRNGLYYRYYLQHNVPRKNNATSTFNADQYLLEIYSLVPLNTFFSDTNDLLEICGVCEIEEHACFRSCIPLINFPKLSDCNSYNEISCEPDEPIITYDCIDNICVPITDPSHVFINGPFPTQSVCQDYCEFQIISYSCINGQCIDPGDGSGLYDTLEDCQIGCISESYVCDPETFSCYDPLDGSGVYATIEECLELCADPIPDTFDCVDGTCILNNTGNGVYATLQLCEENCIFETFSCEDGVCFDPGDGSGIYASLAACQANLVEFSLCSIDKEFVGLAGVDPEGFYNHLASQTNFDPIYITALFSNYYYADVNEDCYQNTTDCCYGVTEALMYGDTLDLIDSAGNVIHSAYSIDDMYQYYSINYSSCAIWIVSMSIGEINTSIAACPDSADLHVEMKTLPCCGAECGEPFFPTSYDCINGECLEVQRNEGEFPTYIDCYNSLVITNNNCEGKIYTGVTITSLIESYGWLAINHPNDNFGDYTFSCSGCSPFISGPCLCQSPDNGCLVYSSSVAVIDPSTLFTAYTANDLINYLNTNYPSCGPFLLSDTFAEIQVKLSDCLETPNISINLSADECDCDTECGT